MSYDDEVDRLVDAALGVGEDRNGPDTEAQSSAAATETDLPSTGLLSFYDRLRGRIHDTVAAHGGKLGERVAAALLLVPDVFILLLRLLLDRDTPSSTKALLGGALAYFVLPADLLPEAIVGAGGYVEDLVLAAVVLSYALSEEVEPLARRHWSGPDDLRKTLRDVVRAAQSLLGENLWTRLQRLLQRRGIPVEHEPLR